MSFIKPAAGADFLDVFLGCKNLVSTSPLPIFFQKSRSKRGKIESHTLDGSTDSGSYASAQPLVLRQIIFSVTEGSWVGFVEGLVEGETVGNDVSGAFEGCTEGDVLGIFDG